MKKLTICLIAMLSLVAFAQEIKDGTKPDPNSVGTAPEAVGGPDAYGYTWDDGVPGGLITLGTPTAVFSGDDVAGVVALGAPFTLYGQTYNALTMASNGYISTDGTDTGPDLSNDCPLPATPSTGGGARIYPLHDDLISDGWYEYFATCPRPADRGSNGPCHVFMWENTTHFGGSTSWDMQVVIYEISSDIVCLIGPGNDELGSGSTTGLQDEAAAIGLTYACDTGGSIPDGTAVAFFNPDYEPIPTLGEYGLMILVGILMVGALIMMRRRS